MKPRDLLERFTSIADVAADVAEALAPIGGDVGRRARRAAEELRRAADIGVAGARAAERFALERERVASELRGMASTIESPSGYTATINGVETPLTVVPRAGEAPKDRASRTRRRGRK